MKHQFTFLASVRTLLAALTCLLYGTSLSAALLEDGIYSISCIQRAGYVALGAQHAVEPFICYVMDGSELTDDAYWVVKNTDGGVTLRNAFSNQWLVYTPERVDAYYKNMTLSDTEPTDGSHLWWVSQNDDGTLSLESAVAAGYFWNLRASQGLLGTYAGSTRSENERYVFTQKSGGGGEQPEQPTELTAFPAALNICFNDGRVVAFPLELIEHRSESAGQLNIQTTDGQTFAYDLQQVLSVSEEVPADFPTFESFKFNNKFNDQLFTDSEGQIVADTVFLTVAAIGKRLTPSFKVPDEQTEVYVNGQRQDSKVSRLRFDHDIYYVVTRPGCTILLPDGEGNYSMQPYGRLVRVHVDWLTDHADVPRIDIWTADGDGIYTKEYFEEATITINGQGAFPDLETTDIQIKGRGNSSWSWPKKPYRIKFEQKVKPLGMKKGKNWVLLSNYQRGSLMTNAIGMKAANLMGAAAANHIVPVDLYINGEYQGNYNFTEKVGLAGNSVDLEDETAAALLELDSYYDEPDGQKFHSVPYNLPINVKNPDFATDDTRLTLDMVEADFNQFMTTLYRGQDISRHVDVEQLVRFLMVNELINNYELYHPKSTFCYRESFESDTSKYVFGPVWDLDWAFGYEGHSRYFQDNSNTNYWLDMPNFEVKQFIQDLRFRYEPMGDLYRQLWEQFMERDLTELMEFCQDYYDFARQSFERNSYLWGDNTDYRRQVSVAANWLQTRANQIYEDIVNGVQPEQPKPVEPVEFANDKLYTITCRRGELVLNDEHTGLDVGQTRWWAPDEDRQFAIINVAGNNYLYSPVTRQFLVSDNDGTWVDRLGAPVFFDDSHADGEYLYMMSILTDGGATLYFNNNGSRLVINSWNTPDDGDRWRIEPVADFDPTEALQLAEESLMAVTFQYVYDGQVIGSETHKLPAGSLMPEPTELQQNSFVSLQPVGQPPLMVTEPTAVPYEVIWNGPFHFTHSLDDATWYNMTIRTRYHVFVGDEEPYYPATAETDAQLQQPEYQWAFGGNPLRVLVYNRATGLNQVLTREGDNAVMRPGDYGWDLLANADGFVLREPGTDLTCINQFGGSHGPLQFWTDNNSPTDDGSTFRISPAVIDGIEDIDLSHATIIHDLMGRRLERIQQSGIYIINGRKVSVKVP